MKDFLKKPVPMWVALALGAGLSFMSVYSFLQMMFFGTLAGVIQNADVGAATALPPVLNDYMLCHERSLYLPRAVYRRTLGICR